jgi:hypothetical protein
MMKLPPNKCFSGSRDVKQGKRGYRDKQFTAKQFLGMNIIITWGKQKTTETQAHFPES